MSKYRYIGVYADVYNWKELDKGVGDCVNLNYFPNEYINSVYVLYSLKTGLLSCYSGEHKYIDAHIVDSMEDMISLILAQAMGADLSALFNKKGDTDAESNG